jgi:hypothetical protein
MFMMSYEDFLKLCKDYKLNPFDYLIRPDLFRNIQDNNRYDVIAIAYYMECSPRHVRRVLKKGQASPVVIRPLLFEGIAVKRAVFKAYYQDVMNRTSFKTHLYEKKFIIGSKLINE